MDGRLYTELALGLIGCDQLQAAAPFVAKTYQMVCDPRTDELVRWGSENNSFVIADAAGFSQLLLPCFFKHSNFSSFVRQLNTYGFRKVHPDRWEFAHESFLRGLTHLLPRIVRRKKRGECGGGASCSSGGGGGFEQHVDVVANMGEEVEEEGREALFEEVQMLRQEQTAIGDELARMSRRLQVTERRPDQLMSFIARLAEDPNAVISHLLEQAAEKKRRRMQLPTRDSTASSLPPPLQPAPPPQQPPPLALGGVAMDSVGQWAEQNPVILPAFEPPNASCGVQQVPEFGGGGSRMSLTDGETTVETPFPFCLLGQGFF